MSETPFYRSEKPLDKPMESALKEHFQVWTGGFPPEDEEQIFTYMDGACPFPELDEKEVRLFLHKWMQEALKD